jgi:hypothetical protein
MLNVWQHCLLQQPCNLQVVTDPDKMALLYARLNIAGRCLSCLWQQMTFNHLLSIDSTAGSTVASMIAALSDYYNVPAELVS